VPEATYEDKIIHSLGPWAEASISRLSPLVGPSDAWILTDNLVSEAIGRLLDEAAAQEQGAGGRPVPGGDTAGPDYSDLREFFERFAPEVVHYLPRKANPPMDLARLREIHRAFCRKMVAELPMTLGRFGSEIFCREWKRLLEDLPYRAEASWRLAHAAGGEEEEAACRAELDIVLAPLREESHAPDDLLRLRERWGETLRRYRPRKDLKQTIR
jgi:hypothetical protein